VALVDVVRSAVQASVQVPLAKGEPLRTAVDVKIGGATCNVSPNLDPWLTVALSAAKLLQTQKARRSGASNDAGESKSKYDFVQEGPTKNGLEELQNGTKASESVKAKKQSKIVWDIAFSAPDAVLVLYGPGGSQVLKVRRFACMIRVAGETDLLDEAHRKCLIDKVSSVPLWTMPGNTVL
jgi:hypothetical protein